MHLNLKWVILMMDQIGNKVLIQLTGALAEQEAAFRGGFFLLN